MRRCLFFALAFWFVSGTGSLFASGQPLESATYDTISNQVVRPFFRALKEGDVGTIKRLISKKMYEERKTLLEENPEYGAFLRRFYKDAQIVPGRAVLSGRAIRFEVNLQYPGGRGDVVPLRLEMDAGPAGNGGTGMGWKVTEW
jgi:hypothetical protein